MIFKEIEESLLGNEIRILPSNYTYSDLKGIWIEKLSKSSLSGRFIGWVLNDKNLEFSQDLTQMLLNTCEDPGAFATISSMLSQGYLSASSFSKKNISVLFKIIEDQKRFHGLRGQVLLVLSLIALKTPSTLKRLRGHFFSIDESDDSRYLRYVAAVIGMLSSHFPISEAEEQLIFLRGIEDVAEEASLQLGFYYVAQGLESSELTKALANFECAREEFKIAVSRGEGRPDAQLLYQCLTFLIKFHEGANLQAKEDLELFNNAIFEYSILLLDSEATKHPTGSKGEEAYRWMIFSSRLSMLSKSFNEQVWLEAARVIEEQLFFTYSAQHSIFKCHNKSGVATIVKPAITGRIQENNFHYAAVKTWLENVGSCERNKEWREFYESVNKKLETGIFRNPDNATGISSNLVADIKEELSRFGKGKEWLKKQFSDSKKAFEDQLPSPAISAIHEKLLDFLRSCNKHDDILSHEDAKTLFFVLVERVLNFLKARKNSPSSRIRTLRYLHADFEYAVKEEHLQDDLFEFLQSGTQSPNISYEPRKHAGGRADILVSYINVKTVIELKKVDHRMTDEEILITYGPQATTYQVADTNFCFLGILDNYDNNGVQIDLRDSFSCHRWTPKGGSTLYSVIIFRVQGKRKPPSELSKISKKSN